MKNYIKELEDLEALVRQGPQDYHAHTFLKLLKYLKDRAEAERAKEDDGK